MKKMIILSFILLQILMVTGCSQSKLVDPIPSKHNYTNEQILLYAFKDYNTFTTADVITAEIWNLTENPIEFPNNYNIRIFERTKQGWFEIYEKPVTRFPSGPFSLNPEIGVEMLGVFPDLPDISREYDLRIYVSGQLYENEKIIEVFAYTDVTLKP